MDVVVEWEVGRWHKLKFGAITGLTLWSPPDKPEWKYPYLAYDYGPVSCVEWEHGRECKRSVGFFPEGTYLYIYNWVQMSRRHGNFRVAIGVAREGASYEEKGYWKAENVEKVINGEEVILEAMELVREAYRRGWRLARSTREENLLAVWAVVNGIVGEIPVEPRPEMKIASAAEEPTLL